MDEFVYERIVAPCGIAIEEIYGAEEKTAKVWKLFAMQIFSEANGDYREIMHLDNGAPVLDGIAQRISISHTSHFLAVASIPKTPDINTEDFNMRTAIGVDIEKADRSQVIKIREKFLTQDEMSLLPAVNDDPEEMTQEMISSFILAWTCKEAMYKAAMGEAKDWRNDYRILSLPKIASNIAEATPEKYGKGTIYIKGAAIELHLSAWQTEGHILTLAFSSKIARYDH
ncbi:MAG: 4'-phosphopantetheinyl transferase superfamily protein [Muribaculaceae bacterium]|nr:4'-phosphopantetheinyl transferase superfamily protein [Muribaculaceae bacterium]